MKIDAGLTNLCDAIVADSQIDGNGVITVSDELVGKTLPEGLSVENFNQSINHVSSLARASLLAAGTMGAKAVKENPSLANVSIAMRIGERTNSINVSHSIKTSREGLAAPGSKERKTLYGLSISSATLDAIGKDANPAMKAVRKHVRTIYEEAFRDDASAK